MAAVINVKKSRVDKDGNIQRQKYKGAAAVSLGYGIYLGDSFDQKSGIFKAFFLMTSFNSADGSIVHSSDILASPRMAGISLDDFPFSKKFTAADLIIESLTQGESYWFAYTSEATSSIIEGKSVTYESLDLIAVEDTPGLQGVYGILSFLGLQKVSSNT